jgi:hypothetical protein
MRREAPSAFFVFVSLLRRGVVLAADSYNGANTKCIHSQLPLRGLVLNVFTMIFAIRVQAVSHCSLATLMPFIKPAA